LSELGVEESVPIPSAPSPYLVRAGSVQLGSAAGSGETNQVESENKEIVQ